MKQLCDAIVCEAAFADVRTRGMGFDTMAKEFGENAARIFFMECCRRETNTNSHVPTAHAPLAMYNLLRPEMVRQ
jgi:hypothetical protein